MTKYSVCLVESISVILAAAMTATAADYHVDPNKGADANDGSIRAPWQHLSHAGRRLRPGDTVYLREAACVHDPIKTFNVYGYGMCCCASSNIEALARYVGLDARGWAINAHSVSEVYWDDAWHLLDSSLINYFPDENGKIASVEELTVAVKAWYDKHPGYLGNNGKLDQFHRADGWTGWKKRGPEI